MKKAKEYIIQCANDKNLKIKNEIDENNMFDKRIFDEEEDDVNNIFDKHIFNEEGD